MWFSNAAYNKNDENGSSIGLMTGPRVEKGLSQSRTYSMQDFKNRFKTDTACISKLTCLQLPVLAVHPVHVATVQRYGTSF